MAGPIFYVYEHWRPDRDECFYVGKGRGRRANAMYNRNRHHTAIQNKLSRLGLCVEVKLVAVGLTEEDAYALEMERISFWRNDGCDLTNMTAGGEGGTNPAQETRELMRKAKLGRKLSEEQKAKIRESCLRTAATPEHRAKLSEAQRRIADDPVVKANRIAGQKKRGPRSKEHGENISRALMGRKASPGAIEKMRQANLGRKQSPETIERRRVATTGLKRSPEFCALMQSRWTPERREREALRWARPVICTTNGMKFSSAKAAGIALNCDSSMVAKVCRGLYAGTKGYSFKYCNEYTPEGVE